MTVTRTPHMKIVKAPTDTNWHTQDPWEHNNNQQSSDEGVYENFSLPTDQIRGGEDSFLIHDHALTSVQNIEHPFQNGHDINTQASSPINHNKKHHLTGEVLSDPGDPTLWSLSELQPCLDLLNNSMDQGQQIVNGPPSIGSTDSLSDQNTPVTQLDIGTDEESAFQEELSPFNNLGGKTAPTLDAAFACPFYRKFPVRHMDCVNRRLMRIRDVKQHIQRRHTRDFCYCPTCFEGFCSELDQDYRVRSPKCKQHEWPTNNFNGVSQEAQEKLKCRVNRTQTATEQWYSIWDIVFFGERRPDKPYLGTIVEETSEMITDFWSQEASQMMPKFLKQQKVPARYEGTLGRLMEALFREVGSRFQMRMLGFSVAENVGSNDDSHSCSNNDYSSHFLMGIDPTTCLETQQGAFVPDPIAFQIDTATQLATPPSLSDCEMTPADDGGVFEQMMLDGQSSGEGMAVSWLTDDERWRAGLPGCGLHSTIFDQSFYWGTEHRPEFWHDLDMMN